ncbi:hypothetical protein AS29_005160 [Bacillus sp. SJS]|nr:hypothetical protein AS29_005160 [Bacillus sp. SJS]
MRMNFLLKLACFCSKLLKWLAKRLGGRKMAMRMERYTLVSGAGRGEVARYRLFWSGYRPKFGYIGDYFDISSKILIYRRLFRYID